MKKSGKDSKSGSKNQGGSSSRTSGASHGGNSSANQMPMLDPASLFGKFFLIVFF